MPNSKIPDGQIIKLFEEHFSNNYIHTQLKVGMDRIKKLRSEWETYIDSFKEYPIDPPTDQPTNPPTHLEMTVPDMSYLIPEEDEVFINPCNIIIERLQTIANILELPYKRLSKTELAILITKKLISGFKIGDQI